MNFIGDYIIYYNIYQIMFIFIGINKCSFVIIILLSKGFNHLTGKTYKNIKLFRCSKDVILASMMRSRKVGGT